MNISHNNQKKIAVINDFSGFGRCSLAVALPIISVMRIQCCPLPTSIFSNHTGFDSYFFDDYTRHMPAYMNEWNKLGLTFDGICTGFLGSAGQIGIVTDFFRRFKKEETTVVVDPVMGDYGEPYATYTPEMCQQMKQLVQYADILTPNLTECCLLTDTPYKKSWTMAELGRMAFELSNKGPQKIVITGIPMQTTIANYCYETGEPYTLIKTHKIGTSRSGTGDIFASIVAADAVNGVNFQKSVLKASRFIKKCIARSVELEIPTTDGVCFEEYLYTLT